jgi:acyl transferase domain-containing protein
MMEPIMEQFGDFLSKQELRAPTLNYISNVTGTWIEAQEATDPQYWVRHLRTTVQFHKGITTLLKSPHKAVLEVGPGAALSRLANQHAERTPEHLILSSLKSEPSSPEFASVLKAAGALWRAGIALDWKSFYKGERRRRVPLPTYPFERRRCWIEQPIRDHASEHPATKERGCSANGTARVIPARVSVPQPQQSRPSQAHSIISAQLNVIRQQLRALKAHK